MTRMNTHTVGTSIAPPTLGHTAAPIQSGEDATDGAMNNPRRMSHDGTDPEPANSGTMNPTPITSKLTARLFVSHFLSTWNSRLFEAAVVYFLADIFPNNLLPISLYALLRNAVAIVLTAPVGSWIDRGNRLTVVRASIVGQRISVAASCGIFWTLLWRRSMSQSVKYGLFAATVLLACIEKLSAGINLVSVREIGWWLSRKTTRLGEGS